MDPDMPACVLQKGTTAGQKRIVATISTLEEQVNQHGVETPAIIVVGSVCSMAEEFSWYEKLPLSGWRVLVTRPKDYNSQTAQKLREKGAEVLELPSIRTMPVENNTRLDGVIRRMEGSRAYYQWIVFTSPTGVDVFFDELSKRQKDIRLLGDVRIAVLGEGTKKKLEAKGIFADMIPSVYDGDTLGKELSERVLSGERILIARAEAGNQNLVHFLEGAGAIVEDVPTYRTEYANDQRIDLKAEFDSDSVDCVVFTSASTVMGFAQRTEGINYSKVKAACIGKQTKAAADALGMKTYMAKKATIDSLIELVVEMRGRNEWT